MKKIIALALSFILILSLVACKKEEEAPVTNQAEQERISLLENELNNLKQELESTKQELNNTKIQLDDTLTELEEKGIELEKVREQLEEKGEVEDTNIKENTPDTSDLGNENTEVSISVINVSGLDVGIPSSFKEIDTGYDSIRIFAASDNDNINIVSSPDEDMSMYEGLTKEDLANRYIENSNFDECIVEEFEDIHIGDTVAKKVALTGKISGQSFYMLQILVPADEFVCVTYTMFSESHMEEILESLEKVKVVVSNNLESTLPIDIWNEPEDKGNESNSELSDAIGWAKDYIELLPASHEQLLDYLLTLDYTNEIAEQAIESCNIDWNEQAANMAKKYTEILDNVSAEDIKSLLKSDKYTDSEIEYALSTLE